MKKLINQVENVLTEQLEGIGLAHPELIRVNLEPRYICRADAPVRGRWQSSQAAAAVTSRCTAVS